MSLGKSEPPRLPVVSSLGVLAESAMHYYQFNIGDYQSHTGHLEPLEDIAYRRMLDWCYLHERPLPDDVDQIAKLIRMRSHSDCIANVLQEFFARNSGGWWQERIGKEINKTASKSEKAKASAEARWLKAKVKDDANALQAQSESNATHNTLPITQDTSKSISPPDGGLPVCDHKAVIELYHEALPTLRRVEVWNDTRAGYLRQRWREVAVDQSCKTAEDALKWWRQFFEYIGKSRFLTGRINDKSGRQFVADLEWILKPANFAKIIEGKYHGS